MSTRDIDRVYGDPELAWRVLGLLNVYRLLVPSILSVVAGLSPTPRALGAVAPALFSATLVGMFAAGVLCIVLLKRRWPDLRVQAYLHIGFDIFAVSLLLLSSGGVESGLGLLLIMPVGAISLLVANRTAVLVAAISALCILFIQGAFVLGDLAEAGSFTQAGILGAVVFIVALGAAPLADRLRESEALVRQRELDLANLAELSQYVVERLRESIIVVDEQDRVRLINESARQILSPGDSATDALLGEVSPRLLYLLETWRQKPLDDGHGRRRCSRPTACARSGRASRRSATACPRR
jgi:two-component system, NtrC family, sensor histidine kinase PilS